MHHELFSKVDHHVGEGERKRYHTEILTPESSERFYTNFTKKTKMSLIVRIF